MAWPDVFTPQLDAVSIQKPARPPAETRPRLSVIVVNYRQWQETSDLVRQLVASETVQRGAAEVVIVDNHSPKHPAIAKLRRAAHVSLRRWSKNHGFARAVNEGCRLSRGEFFLLLNPDVTLSDDFLDEVLTHAEALIQTDPGLGVVGFHLRNPDGSRQLSTGPVPTLASTLMRLALPRHRRKYSHLASTGPEQAEWVTGCCLLVRRECFEQLGGFDERFFLYYEDVDLCQRARELGWSVWYDPTLAVIHRDPLHGRPQPAVMRLVTRHSLLTFAHKHWPRWQARLLTRIVKAEGVCRSWWNRFRGDPREAAVFGHLRELANEVLADQPGLARQRLEAAIRKIDVRVGV